MMDDADARGQRGGQVDRLFDDPVTRDLHRHAYQNQQHAHRLRVALANAAAAGDISREDRRVRHHVESGVMIVDLIAYAVGGFILGGITVGLLVLWWMR